MGNELGREGTEDELGEELGIATEKVAGLRSVALSEIRPVKRSRAGTPPLHSRCRQSCL
jgi:hypothetical protein